MSIAGQVIEHGAEGVATGAHIPPSLRALVLKGSIWSVAAYGANQCIRFLSNLVLTRLLFPEAFGLMSLVNVVLQGMDMLSDLGVNLSIVQHPRGDDPAFLNTAWSLQILRGLALSAICLAASWPIAALYGQPQLALLLAAASAGPLIGSFASMKLPLCSRNLQVARLAVIETIVTFAGSALTVIAAILFRSVWALVLGSLASVALRVVLSHAAVRGPSCRLGWDREAVKAVLRFGGWAFASTATWFMASQGERLLLGRCISLRELGLISIALMLSQMLVALPTSLLSSIGFPLLARSARGDRGVLLSRYTRIRRLNALALSVPLVVGLAGNLLVHLVFDSRYYMVGWMLQMLSLRAMVDLFVAPMAELLKASVGLRCATLANVARIAATLIGIWAGFAFGGLHGVVIGLTLVSIPSAVVFLVGISMSFREIALREWSLFAGVALVIFARLVAGFWI